MKKTKNKTKILFVCLGNICRSPAAEAVMKHIVEREGTEALFFIDSAGIGGWHTGQLPDERMRSVAAKQGYSLVSRARQVKAYDFDDFDMILCMDQDNFYDLQQRAPSIEAEKKVKLLASFLPAEMNVAEIPDPYYGGRKGFEHVLQLIEQACEALYAHIMKH